MRALKENVMGGFSLLLYLLNTIVVATPLFVVAILKFIIPHPAWRDQCTKLLTTIAQRWVEINGLIAALKPGTRWDVQGIEGLDPNDWYLVLSNHQTWVDILVLQHVFNRKIPFIKFFIKKELFWVPILGLAWWALDYPFMMRYSESFLKKNPHLKGKDMETTRKACEKFKTMPIAIMNFPEGTRFTPQKHAAQKSPFSHLLKPKAGGTGFVLSAMGEHLNAILNVTIAYPKGVKSFWEFACGKLEEVVVRVERIDLSKDLMGDYSEDAAFRAHFQDWINTLWRDKDAQLARIKQDSEGNTPARVQRAAL